jgi:hypothetical protein
MIATNPIDDGCTSRIDRSSQRMRKNVVTNGAAEAGGAKSSIRTRPAFVSCPSAGLEELLDPVGLLGLREPIFRHFVESGGACPADAIRLP